MNRIDFFDRASLSPVDRKTSTLVARKPHIYLIGLDIPAVFSVIFGCYF